MAWTTLPNPPQFTLPGSGTFTGQPEGVQLLNDGRVLVYWFIAGIFSYSSLFTPAANGSYESGTWGPIRDMGFEFHGGHLYLAPNGYVYCMGSHPFAGTDTGQYKIVKWDPKTDAWSPLVDSFGAARDFSVQHQGRGMGAILDDNRFVFVNGNGLRYFDYLTETMVNDPSVADLNASEAGKAILPDGRLMYLLATGNYVTEIKPQYDASRVAAGSISSGGNAVTVSPTTITGSGVETWPYDSSGPDWIDRSGFGLNSEIGPHMYYYKNGKLTMCGAYAGEIYEVDPTTKNATCRVKTPIGDINTDPAWTAAYSATLSSAHAGQTAAQIVASGSMSFTIKSGAGGSAPPTFVVLPTSNGRWVAINGTATPSGAYTAGDVITMTGLSLGHSSLRFGGDSTSVIPTNARVLFSYAYQMSSGEGPCAILPSGRFAYTAGVRVAGYIAAYGHVFLWDGTASAPVKTQLPSSIVPSPWLTHMTVLPNGQLFMQCQGLCYVYTEEGAGVDTTQRPVVDNVPAYLGQGNPHTIVGRQLTGIHVGATYGDETSNQCNHTLVRLTAGDGSVYFCPTTQWSYRGIQPNRPGACVFTVPTTVPLGAYTLHAIANGVESTPYPVTVVPGTAAEGIFINSYRTS